MNLSNLSAVTPDNSFLLFSVSDLAQSPMLVPSWEHLGVAFEFFTLKAGKAMSFVMQYSRSTVTLIDKGEEQQCDQENKQRFILTY